MMLNEILIAGFGGQGIMLMGKLLAYGAIYQGLEVTFYPSYGPEMRGGTAHCHINISEKRIGSPLVSISDVLIAMNLPSLDKFENEVGKGGVIFVNSSLIQRKVQRKDVEVVYIPATEIADKLGQTKAANMVMLGAYTGYTELLSLKSVVAAAESVIKRKEFKEVNEKAIKKGTGDLEGVSFEEILYEGYGPKGVAMMVEVLTDNRNRTGPELKRTFEKHGGTLGTSGCVSWMFSKKGLITVGTSDTGEEQLMEIALAAGAEDMQTIGGVYEITCKPSAYGKLKEAIKEKDITTEVAEISMVPQNTVPVSDAATAKKIIALMEVFEDHDDVQNVYANFDIPDEIMVRIS